MNKATRVGVGIMAAGHVIVIAWAGYLLSQEPPQPAQPEPKVVIEGLDVTVRFLPDGATNYRSMLKQLEEIMPAPPHPGEWTEPAVLPVDESMLNEDAAKSVEKLRKTAKLWMRSKPQVEKVLEDATGADGPEQPNPQGEPSGGQEQPEPQGAAAQPDTEFLERIEIPKELSDAVGDADSGETEQERDARRARLEEMWRIIEAQGSEPFRPNLGQTAQSADSQASWSVKQTVTVRDEDNLESDDEPAIRVEIRDGGLVYELKMDEMPKIHWERGEPVADKSRAGLLGLLIVSSVSLGLMATVAVAARAKTDGEG